MEAKLEQIGLTGTEVKLLNNFLAKKNSNKISLEWIHIENGIVSATNGTGLIRIHSENIKKEISGVYKIISKECLSKKADLWNITLERKEASYPNIKEVLRKTESEVGVVIISLNECELTKAVLQVFRITQKAINYRFFEDIAVFKYAEYFKLYSDTNPKTPIFLESTIADKLYLEIVLLPFKLDIGKIEDIVNQVDKGQKNELPASKI